jgi:adenylosuccinate lyase
MDAALHALSPLDGRYSSVAQSLSPYFSEFALIRYRLHVEVEYLLALKELGLPALTGLTPEKAEKLRHAVEHFSEEDALHIKSVERVTNHDVKAVEYFLKDKLTALGLEDALEFVHFGLTSQDINNTAFPISLKDFHQQVYLPLLDEVVNLLADAAAAWSSIPLLARTHGQPASPTRLGKEIGVFEARIHQQRLLLASIPFGAKFGGATGNFNAHYAAYPNQDWHAFADQFVAETLGLHRSFPTTQIEHYDHLAAYFDNLKRINTILIDLCRDVWTYVSMDYFKQKIQPGEVGSSAMPHKVNPIDFENAEGNLGLANALLEHLSAKLPISRLQRDLTDSTVLRNVGVPLGHTVLAMRNLQRGWKKLVVNEEQIRRDLDQQWAVVAEGIQTILRREGYPKPYEALKALTRTHAAITEASISEFIRELAVSDDVKTELRALRPDTYLGR